jgi:hypothetical protein
MGWLIFEIDGKQVELVNKAKGAKKNLSAGEFVFVNYNPESGELFAVQSQEELICYPNLRQIPLKITQPFDIVTS